MSGLAQPGLGRSTQERELIGTIVKHEFDCQGSNKLLTPPQTGHVSNPEDVFHTTPPTNCAHVSPSRRWYRAHSHEHFSQPTNLAISNMNINLIPKHFPHPPNWALTMREFTPQELSSKLLDARIHPPSGTRAQIVIFLLPSWRHPPTTVLLVSSPTLNYATCFKHHPGHKSRIQAPSSYNLVFHISTHQS